MARPTVDVDIEAAAAVADLLRCPTCHATASLAAALDGREIPECCGSPMVFALHAPAAIRRESA